MDRLDIFSQPDAGPRITRTRTDRRHNRTDRHGMVHTRHTCGDASSAALPPDPRTPSIRIAIDMERCRAAQTTQPHGYGLWITQPSPRVMHGRYPETRTPGWPGGYGGGK